METVFLKSKVSEPASSPGIRPFEAKRSFLIFTAALVLCFSLPLYRLARFALSSEFYSYVVLMPFVSWYLARVKKHPATLPAKKMWLPGFLLLAASAGLMIWRAVALREENGLELEDDLSFTTFAFYLALIGIAVINFGADTWKKYAFPFGLLLFAVPMPILAREHVEKFLQYGSAFSAEGMLKLSGMPVVRNDLVLQLPGIPLMVAPECSGIHSSWILLITSFLAACLFLKSPARRAILIACVLPLALLRNGFRIFVIGQLCVHLGPQMINHWIHRKGGPIFFVLSLIPFFLLLVWLHCSERKKALAARAVSS